jgi:hypothetical protein
MHEHVVAYFNPTARKPFEEGDFQGAFFFLGNNLRRTLTILVQQLLGRSQRTRQVNLRAVRKPDGRGPVQRDPVHPVHHVPRLLLHRQRAELGQ